MKKLSNYRVLIAGILSPLAALFLYALVYSILKRAGADLERIGSFVSPCPPSQ